MRANNPNVRFTETGNLREFGVTEGQRPTGTETKFTFDNKGRLWVVSWHKVGASMIEYESIFSRCKTLYGNPRKNEGLAPSSDLTVATATSSFDNNLGGATIVFVADLNNASFPFVLFLETYKY